MKFALIATLAAIASATRIDRALGTAAAGEANAYSEFKKALVEIARAKGAYRTQYDENKAAEQALLKDIAETNAAEAVQKGTAKDLEGASNDMFKQTYAIQAAMKAYIDAFKADALQYDLSGK